MAKYDYQYLVVGSGAAGSAAALMAAGMGFHTAIVESDCFGGTTLNYRDVPYGAALGFGQLYTEAVAGSRFGLSSTSLRYNYPTVLNWQAAAVRRAGGGSRKVFENAGIDCLHGLAQFVGPHVIAVGDQQVSSEKFLIATGTNIAVNGISGIDTVSCWSPDTALRMAKLPKAMAIIGGGSTGCELAEYFAALGVQVVLIEAQDRLLSREDLEVSEVIEKHLRDRLGVKLLLHSRVVALQQDAGVDQVIFVRGGQEKSIRVEAIVLATTPEPATDLGLENAGVKFSYRGINVNQNLRTSNGHIWAAGDVIGGESSTEKATYEGKLATVNALKGSGTAVNYTGFVRMTDTLPKIAKVGLNELECEQIKQKCKTSLVPLDAVSASNTHDFRAGFVKLSINPKTHQILGATVVAPEADLIIQEIALAIRSGLKVEEIAGTPHVATGWSEAVRMAARELS